jgi:ATP synthase protein I
MTRDDTAAVSTPVTVSAGTADPAGRLLRLCLPITAAAVAACVAVGAASGWAAAGSAAIGGLLATAPLAGGVILMRRSARWQPLAVMAAAISAYAGAVFVLGLAWVVLAPAPWLSPNHLAVTIVISTVTWVVAQAVGSARLRVPAFDPVPSDRPSNSHHDRAHAPRAEEPAATRTNRNGADHTG